MSKKTENLDGWFTLAECSAIFGVTRSTFDATYRPIVPAKDVKNAGQRGVLVRVRGLIDALLTQAKLPLLADSGLSKALEAHRKIKARIAMIELERQLATHADVRDLHDALSRFGQSIRRAGESLQRRFGNDASDLLNEAIDEALRQLEQAQQEATE